MLNKRFLMVLALVVGLLVLAMPLAQADASTGDVVARVFLDVNNDVNDAGENGLQG